VSDLNYKDNKKDKFKKMNDYSDIAVVVLNYLTANETEEFISSLHAYYPGIRTIIVDNGSPENILKKLFEISKNNKNISVHKMGRNLGFAKGNNYGINIARKEGYKYIVCSNNDILLNDKRIFEKLKKSMIFSKSAVIGPQIINLLGKNQNPITIKRPDFIQAKRIYKGSSLFRIFVLCVLPSPILNLLRKIKHKIYPVSMEKENIKKPAYVYALHGSFLMFGPKFFEKYNGFDEGTFLYGEEMILAEMLISEKMKAFYEPSASVIHKEDRTATLIWGGQNKFKPLLYSRYSTKYWYKKFYIPNSYKNETHNVRGSNEINIREK